MVELDLWSMFDDCLKSFNSLFFCCSIDLIFRFRLLVVVLPFQSILVLPNPHLLAQFLISREETYRKCNESQTNTLQEQGEAPFIPIRMSPIVYRQVLVFALLDFQFRRQADEDGLELR